MESFDLRIPKREALVLYELLARYEETGALEPLDPAERGALMQVLGALERAEEELEVPDWAAAKKQAYEEIRREQEELWGPARPVTPLGLLEVQERELWLLYEAEEEAGRRESALDALRTFVDALALCPQERISAWVEAICRVHWDGHDPLFHGQQPASRIRHPLLVDLILPTLLDGYRRSDPDATRWLALFTISGPSVNPRVYEELRGLGMPEFDPADLLRQALELDPQDTRAAHTLLHYLAERSDDRLHHLPEVVIDDDPGAWRQELDEFESLLDRYSPDLDLRPRLQHWRLHGQAWAEYQEQDEFDSYPAFLATRGLEASDRP
ncbi:MAG: hypothetical protein ABR521_01535 [Gaiellaceae bacterium]